MDDTHPRFRLWPNASREIAGICAAPGRTPDADTIRRLRQAAVDVFGPDTSFATCGPAIFASAPESRSALGRRIADGRDTAREATIAHMQIAGRVDESQESAGTLPALPGATGASPSSTSSSACISIAIPSERCPCSTRVWMTSAWRGRHPLES